MKVTLTIEHSNGRLLRKDFKVSDEMPGPAESTQESLRVANAFVMLWHDARNLEEA